MATNGTITKKILKAAKTGVVGPALKSTFVSLLHKFPLSSKHLVYDEDKAKVPEAAWALLLEAAVETDKYKYDSSNSWLVSLGGKPSPLPYGRYNG